MCCICQKCHIFFFISYYEPASFVKILALNSYTIKYYDTHLRGLTDPLEIFAMYNDNALIWKF